MLNRMAVVVVVVVVVRTRRTMILDKSDPKSV